MKSSKAASGKTTTSTSPTSNYGSVTSRAIEIVSVKDASAIARIDADRVSTDPGLYVKLNVLTYHLILNLWLFQVFDKTERGGFDLLEAIAKKGLIAVIAECDGTANHAIRRYTDDPGEYSIPGYLTTLLSTDMTDADMLQLLRFPKRFSPDGADLIAEASVKELLKTNDRCKYINGRGFCPHITIKDTHKSYVPSRYWIDRIRDRVHDMMRGFDVDYTLGFFSAGVAADARRPLGDKLIAYARWEPSLYSDVLYPIAFGATPRTDSDWRAEIRTVPKSYKAARVIAMESSYRQFHMQAIRMEMERCLERNGYKDYLDLHSQVRNQDYAFFGSRDGVYATIDLSSASDSVTRVLAYELFPKDVVHEFDKYLPTTMRYGGKKPTTMHMFCTSGSAVTFPVESVIFLAIALEVRDTVAAITGENLYLPPCVFGDDIVVDTALFDTTVEVLTHLGFRVNPTKSFGPGSSYRESCGREFVCGYDLQTRYWPRATFSWAREGLATSIAQLCSLEHKLYGNYRCKVFLTQIVRSLEPRMTSHAVGSECVDLWEDIPVYLTVPAPADDKARDPFVPKWSHEHLGLSSIDASTAADARVRHMHLTLKTRRKNKLEEKGHDGFDKRMILETWRFARFLRFGPTFDDELLRLLGVSTKPTPLTHDADTGEQYWSYTAE